MICLDKLDYCASINNIKCFTNARNFTFVQGDVTDADGVLHCLRENSIDTVIHFAALLHVDRSFEAPASFATANVIGTMTLLEAAVKCHVRRFIHVSTDEVTGEYLGEDVASELTFKPTNPYAASKAAAEMFVEAYAKSYQLPCIIVRSNNVYGPQQYPESKSEND